LIFPLCRCCGLALIVLDFSLSCCRSHALIVIDSPLSAMSMSCCVPLPVLLRV
jgi:hypothetical protein